MTMVIANMGPGFHHGAEGWGLLGWLLPLLFIGVLVGLVVWLVLRVTQRPATAGGPGWTPAPPPAPNAALEQVRARYARGEITREDFLQMASDLGGAPYVPPAAPPAPGEEPPPEAPA
jgi:putative membrane protein